MVVALSPYPWVIYGRREHYTRFFPICIHNFKSHNCIGYCIGRQTRLEAWEREVSTVPDVRLGKMIHARETFTKAHFLFTVAWMAQSNKCGLGEIESPWTRHSIGGLHERWWWWRHVFLSLFFQIIWKRALHLQTPASTVISSGARRSCIVWCLLGILRIARQWSRQSALVPWVPGHPVIWLVVGLTACWRHVLCPADGWI